MVRALAALLLFLIGAALVAGDGPVTPPPPKAAPRVPNALRGGWVSEGGMAIVFEEKSLQIFMAGPAPLSPLLVADYSVTKDGIVFGIVTRETLSAELKLPKGSFVDETFRFRVHAEGDELTVKDVRLAVPRVAGLIPKNASDGNDPLRRAATDLLKLEGHLGGAYNRGMPDGDEKSDQTGAVKGPTLQQPPRVQP